MKTGDIVQHRKNKSLYGTVEYSRFGYSIHYWSDGALGKTLGESAYDVLKYWKIVNLPKGYKVHQYGGVVKE